MILPNKITAAVTSNNEKSFKVNFIRAAYNLSEAGVEGGGAGVHTALASECWKSYILGPKVFKCSWGGCSWTPLQGIACGSHSIVKINSKRMVTIGTLFISFDRQFT